MPGTYIDIAAADGGKFAGYFCVPRSGRGPGLIVEQEIFGINENVRFVCEEYAKHGFVTLAPDLFWRIEPRIDLDYSEAGWKRAFELFQAFDVDQGMKDVAATIKALRARPECSGKVGCIGYCLGGKLAYLSATRTDADASVGYYGVGLDAVLGEKTKIKKPLMLHIAEKDKFVPPEAQAKVKEALRTVPGVETHSYPNVDHAFARLHGDHYDQAAAEVANSRTLAFLRTHLGV
jgi:carboxymethylenebutenolidase